MDAQTAFIIYKRLDNEINALEIPPDKYLNYKLLDERKIQIYQSLIDSGVDVKKFFLANCILNKDFYIDYYKYNPDKCLTLYYSWDEFLEKKRDDYFRRVIRELKKGYRLHLEDRDKFLELIQVTDYLLWSVLYPEDLELLLSLDDDDWVKFHMPEFVSRMDFIRKVIKGNIVLKHMKSFDKLREKALLVLNK